MTSPHGCAGLQVDIAIHPHKMQGVCSVMEISPVSQEVSGVLSVRTGVVVHGSENTTLLLTLNLRVHTTTLRSRSLRLRRSELKST